MRGSPKTGPWDKRQATSRKECAAERETQAARRAVQGPGGPGGGEAEEGGARGGGEGGGGVGGRAARWGAPPPMVHTGKRELLQRAGELFSRGHSIGSRRTSGRHRLISRTLPAHQVPEPRD